MCFIAFSFFHFFEMFSFFFFFFVFLYGWDGSDKVILDTHLQLLFVFLIVLLVVLSLNVYEIKKYSILTTTRNLRTHLT